MRQIEAHHAYLPKYGLEWHSEPMSIWTEWLKPYRGKDLSDPVSAPSPTSGPAVRGLITKRLASTTAIRLLTSLRDATDGLIRAGVAAHAEARVLRARGGEAHQRRLRVVMLRLVRGIVLYGTRIVSYSSITLLQL